MSAASGRRGGSAGFLLVEALAAMAISAFLLVALASVVSFTLRASARATAAGSDFERSSRVLSALARDIGASLPYRWAAPDADFIFSGTPDRLIFAIAGAGSADEVAMLQAGARNGSSLLWRSASVLRPDVRSLGALAFGDQQEFYRGPASIRFAYVGRQDDGREVITDGWSRPDRMPVAVRISLVDPRSGANLAVLRVPIRVDAEAGCAAPGKARCSFAKKDRGGDAAKDKDGTAEDAPIDPDDPSGWMSYVQE